jgi:hypothetical protein
VNRQHFQAFLWLRGRLLINQLRRGGIANTIILGLLAAFGVMFAFGMFVAFLLVGLFALPKVSPAVLMYVWDGLVVAFLFSWAIGLLAELQRSEALSMDKFLHLPVSLTGVFLLNYLSSLLSISLIVFLPGMIGLSLALVFARGPAMLLLFPLLAAFLLMVTAVTYQFQGWLAALMVNKRRRRTIIVAVTMGFVLLCQLPNLMNAYIEPWKAQGADEAAFLKEFTELEKSYTAKQMTLEQYKQRQQEMKKAFEAQKEQAKASNQQLGARVEQTFRLVNVVLPPGWLPLGAMAVAEGNVLPALLGTLGLTLIGSASLWRSYRTTLRLYTGKFSSGARTVVAAEPAVKGKAVPSRLLESNLPYLSEHTSAIALASLRALLRAPEAKMMLLGPTIMMLVFGSLMWRGHLNPPVLARPVMASGAMAMILFTMIQLIGNQFGFDRSGFRVFVLCPARRRDVLLGKNLAVAPLALGLGLVAAVFLQVAYPMRFDHFLATLFQLLSMYMLFAMLANLLSILAPMPIAAGSLKPMNPKVIPMLLHVAFVFLSPLALAPALLPLGAEFVLEKLGWVQRMPVALVLSLLECAAVAYIYHLILNWQGGLLQAREQRILETVAAKAE